MADAPAKQETEHVKAAPPPADIASDPEEDDLSDLDGMIQCVSIATHTYTPKMY